MKESLLNSMIRAPETRTGEALGCGQAPFLHPNAAPHALGLPGSPAQRQALKQQQLPAGWTLLQLLPLMLWRLAFPFLLLLCCPGPPFLFPCEPPRNHGMGISTQASGSQPSAGLVLRQSGAAEGVECGIPLEAPSRIIALAARCPCPL